MLAIAITGCGRNHQRSENYIANAASPPAAAVPEIWITPTHTDEDGGFFGDREIRDIAPYSVVVIARHADAIKAPLRVHEVRLHVGDQAHVIHDATAPALEAELEEASGSAKEPHAATVRLPLGDKLVFVEGQTVSLDVTATLPGADAPTTVSRTYRTETKEWSGSKIAGYLSQ